MSVIHSSDPEPLGPRQLMLPGVILATFLVLIARLWYLQVVTAPGLQESADRSARVTVERVPPRGQMVDRKGRIVAGVRTQIVVTAIPHEVQKDPKVLDEVAALLGADADRLRAEVEKNAWRPYLPAAIYVGDDLEAASRIVENPQGFPGFAVEFQPMRYYPDPIAFSHVLGYVWTPSDRDEERLQREGVEPGRYVGKDGLEMRYERELQGAPGEETMLVDARRRPLRLADFQAPTPGRELVLTLDADLQAYATQRLEGRAGAVVALDPSTGEILALASAPSYDLSLFEGGISNQEWGALRGDPMSPLQKRGIASAYAPGSTFKLVTSYAMLLGDTFDPGETVYCPGYYQIGNRRIRCLGRHGSIAYQEALEKSCNTYFMAMADRIGVDTLRHACADMHLGERLGIDLPGEQTGIVPTEDYLKRNERRWYGGDTVMFGIGQSMLATTPLQMAFVAATVANRGVGYRPHLVRASRDPRNPEDETRMPREVLTDLTAPASFWTEMHQAMERVISQGTARVAQIQGIRWAGKTGSAENQTDRETHSWFIGFAPIDNPQIAIAVMVENAGHGSEVAAPIARDVVRRFLFPEEYEPVFPLSAPDVEGEVLTASAR